MVVNMQREFVCQAPLVKELVKGKAEINELENKTALINEKPVFSFNNKIKQQLP